MSEAGTKENATNLSSDTLATVLKIDKELTSSFAKLKNKTKIDTTLNFINKTILEVYLEKDSTVFLIKWKDIGEDDDTTLNVILLKDNYIIHLTYNTVLDSIISIYYPNHKMFNIFKSNGKISYNGISTNAQLMQEAYLSFEIECHMLFLPKLKYKSIIPSPQANPILITSASINLKSEPNLNSKTLRRLPNGTPLIYLGADNNLSKVNDLVWAWYKIKTPNNVCGWVFGHPKYIEELNDGD